MKQDGSLGQRAGQRAIRMMGFIKVLIDRLIVGDDLRLDEDLYIGSYHRWRRSHMGRRLLVVSWRSGPGVTTIVQSGPRFDALPVPASHIEVDPIPERFDNHRSFRPSPSSSSSSSSRSSWASPRPEADLSAFSPPTTAPPAPPSSTRAS